MLRLDINLVFTVINLLVLYFFMRKFLFGRVNKILEERKALIEKQFADAKTAQDAADGMKTEYEGKLAAAQGEGEEIIARAKAEASASCWRSIGMARSSASTWAFGQRCCIAREARPGPQPRSTTSDGDCASPSRPSA